MAITEAGRERCRISGAKGGRKGQGKSRAPKSSGITAKIERTPRNAELICNLIVQGLTLDQIARAMGASGHSTILMWKAQDPEFAEQYRVAKDAQADHFAEEIVAIADDGRNDWMEREGHNRVDYEAVGRSKLRVETRLKLMGSYAPRRFGNKIEVEHGMNDSFADVLAAARERRVAALAPPTIDNEIIAPKPAAKST